MPFPLWKEAQKRNLTKISGSNLFQNVITNFIVFYVIVTPYSTFPADVLSKAYENKAKQFATTFKRSGLTKFCLSHLQDKFKCWWCHGIKGSSWMKNDFPVWEQAGHWSRRSWFISLSACILSDTTCRKTIIWSGAAMQKSKGLLCCVPCVPNSQSVLKKRIIKYTNLQNTFWILISQQIWSTLEMKSVVSIHCFAHTESIHFSICRKKTHWDVELQLLSLSAKAGSQNYFKKQICRLLVWLL